MADIPQLDTARDNWTVKLISDAVGVPIRTVRYWFKCSNPNHTGRWRPTREEAQKVVNKMFTYGHKKAAE